jgi:putative addiction module CopG family antidote
MGTNAHLTPELERFAQTRVADGRYNKVCDAARAALRILQEQEAARGAFIRSLEASTADGECRGFVTADDVRPARTGSRLIFL